MSVKKLGAALLAVFVLGAITANSAFATNEFSETGGTWFVGGSKLAEGTTKSLETTAVGTQKLETTVAGVKLDITATGVECVLCDIKNTSATTATIDGRFKFTGVTMSEPAGCSVSGGTVETKALTEVLGMNTAGTKATFKITPETGATLATLELTGPSCVIAGLYKLNGTVFAQAALKTGEFAVSQEISFSKAIQESAGTSTSLKIGENAVFLTGAVKRTLEGSFSWGSEK